MEILLWNKGWFPACFLFSSKGLIQQHLILNKQCRELRRAQRQFPAWTLEGVLCVRAEGCVCSQQTIIFVTPSLTYSYHADFSLHSQSLFDCNYFMSLRMQWSLQDNYCSVPLSLKRGFEYQRYVTLRYALFKMLEYEKKHEKEGDCWRGLMGLRAPLVKWCLTSLLGKCCQWLWAEWRTASLFFVRELGQGWSRGWRHSLRTNCTAPSFLTPHTRSWVVLGAVTSHVSPRALKSSCTCRTWPPCWRAARL